MQAISFRCAAKTEPGAFRIITVLWPGPKAICICDGFNGIICSHIDATLIAGERAMVPDDDRAAADEAMRAIAGHLTVPADWRGSWRYNYAWRGLPTRKYGERRLPIVGLSGKPIVCFTGAMPKPRKELLREAEAAGWETVDRAHSKITILIAADVHGESNKLQFARENGVPILTYEDWTNITTDGEIVDALASPKVKSNSANERP